MGYTVLRLPFRTLNRGKADRLETMFANFTDCARFHLERIHETGIIHPTDLHHNCYREARERFRLTAGTTQQARDKAIHAYRNYLDLKYRGRPTNPPEFRRQLPLRLAAENIRLFPDKRMVRITTADGHLWIPIEIPAVYKNDIHRKHGVSEIVRKGDRYYLMLVVKREDVPAQVDGPHFGVDLGIANTAVLAGPGIAKFFDGKPLWHVLNRNFRYRKALMQKRKIGMIMRSKGRDTRWVTNKNHQVSREIVNIVAAAGGTLHIERLNGIQERFKNIARTAKMRRVLNSWPFAQLLTFLTYKAKAAGVPVVEEDPRHTSQRCSRCGHTERGNRNRQADFACKACGYRCHADLNAARNLAAKGACPLGVGGVTPPCPQGRNGEAVPSNSGLHGDNHNLAISAQETVA